MIADLPRARAVRALQKAVGMSAPKTCVYIVRSLADPKRSYTGVTSDGPGQRKRVSAKATAAKAPPRVLP